jgi:ABC-2 type transport system ATP-binding protein
MMSDTVLICTMVDQGSAPTGSARPRKPAAATALIGHDVTVQHPLEPVVLVDDLRKVFRVPVREAGLKASLSSLFHRETREVAAVDGVTFRIEPNEVVGFLGPNGAGKTTTLKMLSGLLHPTAGSCRVLGYEPRLRPAGLLRQITLVMGNRNQLQWDLPAMDSFELNRAIYRIPRSQFVSIRDELIELLELGDLVTKPVRNLSLGERMKMEIAGSLLHRPKVLFLDEPTIGLDITMQRRIRTFVADYNRRFGATVILTSHYMADVQALCKRVIVIHHGRLLFDGQLAALANQFSLDKTVTARLADGAEIKVSAPRGDIAGATGKLLAEHDVVDLTIEDPPIEDVIEQLFATNEPS